MEAYAIVLVLTSLISGIISIINIIFPIKAIGFANRGRAVHLLALSFLLFLTGAIAGGISAADNPQGNLWIWFLSLVTAYGLFRFVRSGRKPEKNENESVRGSNSNISNLDHEARVPRQRESEWGVSGIDSPRVADDSIGRSRKARKSTARWIQPGSTATVAGRKIGGMIYLGSEPRRDDWKRVGRGFIDPGLPVAKVGSGSDFSGMGTSYWPSYRDINPQERATYLDWLAGGRSDRRIGPGYVFLYFYGLERRFFVDAPADEEKRLLVAETRRLLETYGENHSVQRYLETFLDAAHIALEPAEEAEPRFEKIGYELPLGLRVAIGRMAKEGRLVSADWVLGWYLAHPEADSVNEQ